MPSVTSCAYDRETAEASVDEVNMGSYRIGFIVTTDGLMGPQSVANGALLSSPHPLPSLWSTYSYQGDTDNYSWARKYTVRRDPKSVKLYYITVEYLPNEPGDGSQTVGGDPIRSEPNPVLRAPVIWWDREVVTVHVTKDIDGKSIRNKCEDYYADDIEIEKTKSVLVAEWNVATLGEVYALTTTYENAVNVSPWSVGGGTVPARAALCREVSGSPPQTEQNHTFFHVTMRIVLAEEGQTWDVSMAECGQFHWTKTDGSYDEFGGHRRVTDAQKIVALDSDGTRLADGADMVFTDWRVRREVNFNDLPI